MQATPLKQHFQSATKVDVSDDAIDLLTKMFKYNQEDRITAQQCL